MSKRIKTIVTNNPTGGVDVSVSCKICGKPIIKSNKFGMYCENMCGLEDDKKAYNKIKSIFGGILPL